MRKLLITIRYDGSDYHGYQVQNNAITIQEVFQNSVEKVFGERLDITGCSRTDSGVHANMYCITLDTDMNITNESVVLALNTYLPKDIAAYDCKAVAEDFHPRYSCKSKEYIYKIYNGKYRNPFYDRYSYWYRFPIDAEYLNQEAKAFIGKHDFAGFCSSKSDVEDTKRTIYSFDIWREEDFVYFKIIGDGFLYNMVRIIVGTMLFVAQGKIKSGELHEIISSCNRSLAGKTAPPQGLYLNKINY